MAAGSQLLLASTHSSSADMRPVDRALPGFQETPESSKALCRFSSLWLYREMRSNHCLAFGSCRSAHNSINELHQSIEASSQGSMAFQVRQEGGRRAESWRIMHAYPLKAR